MLIVIAVLQLQLRLLLQKSAQIYGPCSRSVFYPKCYIIRLLTLLWLWIMREDKRIPKKMWTCLASWLSDFLRTKVESFGHETRIKCQSFLKTNAPLNKNIFSKNLLRQLQCKFSKLISGEKNTTVGDEFVCKYSLIHYNFM